MIMCLFNLFWSVGRYREVERSEKVSQPGINSNNRIIKSFENLIRIIVKFN